MNNSIIPLTENNFYHVFNKGNNGERIFYEDRNYEYFLERFNKYLSGYALLYSYCLIPNHFHLLIKVDGSKTNLPGFKNLAGLEKPKTISRAFSDFFNSYTKSINKQENRTGSLFCKPFKRKEIRTNEQFWINVVYIHRNPLHHGLTNSFQTYKWSSYSDIINKTYKYVNSKSVLEIFGGINNFISIHNQAEADFKDIQME